MSPERFAAERGPAWSELEAALRRAGDRPEKLGRDGVRRLGALYRAAAADLAFARRRFPGEPLIARLEALVLRARATVYARVGAARVAVALLHPRLLAPARGAPGARAGGLAAAAGARGGRRRRGARSTRRRPPGWCPAEFQAAADPPAEGRDFDAATASAFSFQVMFNNIQVTLVAFAGGITFGALTVYALFFNGLLLGTIGGLAIGAGNGVAFLRLISSHGPLEISCIVVGGIAGLRIGWALIRPGPAAARRRRCGARRCPRSRWRRARSRGSCCAASCEGFATGPELPGRGADGARGRRCSCCSGGSCTSAGASLTGRRAPWRAGRRRRARAGSRSGGASSTRAPAARTCAAARARACEHVAGDRRAAPRSSGSAAVACGERGQRRVGRARDDDRVAAREDRDGRDQRARGGLLEQVAEDDDERALGALGAAEGELVVAVERARLEVEQRAHDGLAAGAARLERGRGPRRRTRPRRCGRRARRRRTRAPTAASREASSTVMPVRPERRGREAARVEQEQQVAVLLEPVLVAHRPPEPRRRAPVDLADVVVGLVVADQLELGAEAERAARGRALVAEAPAGDGEREPPRGREVGEDAQLGVVAGRWSQRASPSGPVARVATAGQHVAAAPARDDARLERPVALARLDRQRGRRGLADAHACRRRARAPGSLSVRRARRARAPREPDARPEAARRGRAGVDATARRRARRPRARTSGERERSARAAR